LTPDLVNFPTRELYEIKPKGQEINGNLELQERLDILNQLKRINGKTQRNTTTEFGMTPWHSGSMYVPPSVVRMPEYPNKLAFVYGPVNGLITYQAFNEHDLDLSLIYAGIITTMVLLTGLLVQKLSSPAAAFGF
jgi:hypothetical protein